MKYFVCANRQGEVDIIKEYEEEETALKRLKYHLKREKCKLQIIPVPKIEVGCTIYRNDGSCYGTVEYETKNLWGILCKGKGDIMPDPYSKQRIEELIISQGLIITGCEEAPDIEAMMDKREELNKKVEDVLNVVRVNSGEQVTFF